MRVNRLLALTKCREKNMNLIKNYAQLVLAIENMKNYLKEYYG